MLDRLTVSDFIEHLNANFPVDLGSSEVIDLELIEAQTIGDGRRSDSAVNSRQPFSLIFRGPRDRMLPQRIHAIEHPTLGTLNIFLVPIMPEGDSTGLHYQAIFN
jgi:hypothetical protein